MSKKKRLGRGLEALLGVGASNSPENESKTEQAAVDAEGSRNQSKFEITNDGTDVESVNDLLKGEADSAASSPVILPFKASDNPKSGPSKSANMADADYENIDFTKARAAASEGPASNNSSIAPSSQTPDDVPISKFKSAVPSEFANALAAGEQGTSTSESGNQSEPSKKRQVTTGDSSVISSRNSPSKVQSSGFSGISNTISDTDSTPRIVELNVYDVDDNPFQPRREFNKSEIESLAESLKTHDQLQPILVRQVDGRYQLISGERRLRAAIHAGWSKINAQVREADDRLVAELAIVENLQRKDLNPIEKALSFRRYLDEHSCPQDELAGRLKIDRSTVANLLRLLELPQVVQKALQVGLVTNGHARALLPLGEEHLQIEFCNRVQREGLSVRATEQMVREKIDQEDGNATKALKKARTKSGQILSLEKEFRSALGTKTEISATSRGRGKIVIHYTSKEEFERLRDYLVGTELDADAA